jgi:hypothetical protein
MGRHKHVGHVRACAAAVGVGAALFVGAGLAHADTPADRGTEHPAPSHPPVRSLKAHVSPERVRNPQTPSQSPAKPPAHQRHSPLAPVSVGAHHPPSPTAFIEADAQANADPAITSELPSPGDDIHTAYGDIGKWMLRADGQIANFGGVPHGGKTVLEPVNVVIIDSTSTTSAQAAAKLNSAMFWAGFPGQPIHTTGFQGEIDDVVYGQQPACLFTGYSDNFFLFPNDHGRIFGPDPAQASTGYVWSGAFSTETLALFNFLPVHAYFSSDMARTALALRLILSGQATFVGMVRLDNAYNTETTTTGDHDGYAVVLQLR